MLCLPMVSAAQNTWEMPDETAAVKTNPDAKYLAGAVPVVDGRVQFATTLQAPGKSAPQIFNILRGFLSNLAKEENQFPQSRLVLNDSTSHRLCGSYQEWLVFKNKPLELDRTRFMYNIIAECKDGKADITLTRIHYLYDEERQPIAYKAEEWITDEYGLKKKKDKLSRVSGRFRKKTIDRKDYLFKKMAEALR